MRITINKLSCQLNLTVKPMTPFSELSNLKSEEMRMRNNERARQAQFELMTTFMEQHGDIQYLPKLECYKRWIQLTNLLNDKSLGEPRPMDKWRKCWSDLKNNTKKKDQKIKNQECNVSLSSLEERVIKLLENRKKKSLELESDCTIEFQPKIVPDEASCEMPQSPSSQNFVQNVEYVFIDNQKSSHSSPPSVTSETSSEDKEEAPPRKRKKTFLENNIRGVADKYLEFEREREKLAHEREMARIKQSDQLITILGKVVNILERLTPNVQKYLDQETNDDR